MLPATGGQKLQFCDVGKGRRGAGGPASAGVERAVTIGWIHCSTRCSLSEGLLKAVTSVS